MANTGLAQPAAKAAERRTRVSVFGGSLNKKQGRRTTAGKVFNRRNTKPTGQSNSTSPTYTGSNGVDLGLKEGVVPEGNLYNTWTPNPSLSDSNQTYGTLSTGAEGFYDPNTGKFVYYDFPNDNVD